MNHTLHRRHFLKSAAFGAAALSAAPLFAEDKLAYPKGLKATDQLKIGNTGISMSRVAMGTGYIGTDRSSSQTRAGQKSFTNLMRTGFDSGLNFYDMADLYGSHPFMKNAIQEMKADRDNLTLLSKIWFTDSGEVMKATDRAVPSVERFLKELGTDYLDICLIHCLTKESWVNDLSRMRDEMGELKEKGIVRAIGCSCHNFEALEIASKDPWVDVIFSRINNTGESMDFPKGGDRSPEHTARVLKQARMNGKTVVGMKIYGAGKLVEPEQRDESLRYVWGNQLVDAITIGFEKPEQVHDTIDHLNRVLSA